VWSSGLNGEAAMEKLGPRVRVLTVQLLRGFTVLISFENGVQREINLEPYFRRKTGVASQIFNIDKVVALR
jgi:hypothetical protein